MSTALRDRFFALAGSGDEAACAAFRAEVEAVDPEPCTRVLGLAVSYFPTRRFKQLRFLEARRLDAKVRRRFARPCPELPELAAAFVDPEELCFRSFENIICLDRLFDGLGPRAVRCAPLQARGAEVFGLSLHVSKDLRARLERLVELGLFVAPRDASRGGARFIFHAAALAESLTRALRNALPKRIAARFVHVNPVFRCNRFEPNDARFEAHVDSPYYDPSRRHVSRYTLLVYLSGGRGEPALRFGDALALEQIDALTGFVFDQRLEHEGGPFVDNTKLFLRTELVYEYSDDELVHAPGVAELFARACYLDGESVFAPELARQAAAAYNRAAAAHWTGLREPTKPQPFFHRRFRGVEFVTNGYDYWFHERSASLIEGAALTLLDALNAKLDGVAFRKQCESEQRLSDPHERGWIAELLERGEAPAESPFGPLAKRSLIPEPERPRTWMGFPTSPDFSDDPFPYGWEAARNEEVIDAYARARRWALDRIFAAPILMLGAELFLDRERFVIRGDQIHVLSSERLEPVHFAGAVFYRPLDFVDVEARIDAPRLLLPPILIRSASGIVHLSFDLFRNGWMVREQPESVPIPRVVDDEPYPDTEPWLYAAARSSDVQTVRAELEGKRKRKLPRARRGQ